MKIAIVGIGQSLRGDDAAGIEAVERWQHDFPETAHRPEIKAENCELPGLALIDLLEPAQAAILVDAVHSAAQPGTIHKIDLTELSSFPVDSRSAHGWGVAETLELSRSLYPRLARLPIFLIGIEAGSLILGGQLSEQVKKAIPGASRAIQEQVGELLKS